MRMIVCGGRKYGDEAFERLHIFRTLDAFYEENPDLTIIAGGATGTDTLAEYWARSRGVPCVVFPADWKKHKNKAGPIRNQQMLDEGAPDAVMAFPGSTGTADMVRRARKAELKVIIKEALEDES